MTSKLLESRQSPDFRLSKFRLAGYVNLAWFRGRERSVCCGTVSIGIAPICLFVRCKLHRKRKEGAKLSQLGQPKWCNRATRLSLAEVGIKKSWQVSEHKVELFFFPSLPSCWIRCLGLSHLEDNLKQTNQFKVSGSEKRVWGQLRVTSSYQRLKQGAYYLSTPFWPTPFGRIKSDKRNRSFDTRQTSDYWPGLTRSTSKAHQPAVTGLTGW